MLYPNWGINATTNRVEGYLYAVYLRSGPKAREEALKLLKPMIQLGPISVFASVVATSQLPNMQVRQSMLPLLSADAWSYGFPPI